MCIRDRNISEVYVGELGERCCPPKYWYMGFFRGYHVSIFPSASCGHQWALIITIVRHVCYFQLQLIVTVVTICHGIFMENSDHLYSIFHQTLIYCDKWTDIVLLKT